MKLAWSNKNTGFTLVEIVAVIAILLVLGAMVVPNYSRVVAKSKENICRSNLQMLNHAVKVYTEVEGAGPKGQDDLLKNGYIDQEAHCPVSGAAYTIESGTFTCPKCHNNDQP